MRLKLLHSLAGLVVLAAACTSSPNTQSGSASESTEPTVLGEVQEQSTTTSTTTPPLPFADTKVLITGHEAGPTSGQAMHDVLAAWGETQGIAVEYRGDPNWADSITLQVRAGAEPDIALFESPAMVADLFRLGVVKPAAAAVTAEVTNNWSSDLAAFGMVDGVQVGVPIENGIGSMIWYQPAVFAAKGYQVPKTFDEFLALIGQMTTNGDTPLCVGIKGASSTGTRTGESYAGWIGDLLLSAATPDLYDGLATHQIPFNDPAVVAQMQAVLDLWNTPGVLLGGGGPTAASTTEAELAQSLYDGQCLMQRGGRSMQRALVSVVTADGLPPGLADGSNLAVDVFSFPSAQGTPVQATAILAGAFADRPEVWAVMEYLASAEFAVARQAAEAGLSPNTAGFLTVAIGADLTLYTPLQLSMVRILSNATAIRMPLIETLPPAVSSSLLAEGSAAVAREQVAQQAADTIETAWPVPPSE